MRQALASWLDGVWYRQAAPPWPLRVLELVYRRFGDPGGRPARRPPLPVIVVGNLTAGGSGKTPVVQALARHLSHAGFPVGVISRGYGGEEPAKPVRVAPDSDPHRAGDEAVMLAASTDAGVWICRRRRAAMEAARHAGCRVVISDDGLQHRDLPRSLEICVIDGKRRFGNNHLLPAGPLRQPVGRLESVDIHLVRMPGAGTVQLQPGESGFTVEPAGIRRLGEEELQPLSVLGPGPVDAVAGIANPETLFTLLEAAGCQVRRHPRGDHYRYRGGELDDLPGPVVVTAKDAVKLAGRTGRADVWVLEVAARLPQSLLEQVQRHLEEFA